MKSTLILGGQGGDVYYELGLLEGLLNNGLSVDVIGNDAMAKSVVVKRPKVTFYNFREDQNPDASFYAKVVRITKFYLRLVHYAMTTDSTVFHIQWLNKFLFLDRILLNLYYKALGKKLVFTAHNIDARERDGSNSFYNRVTLRAMYHLYDHIIVHTAEMKEQLVQWFAVEPDKVSVVPYGINNMVPKTGLARDDARTRLDLGPNDKVLLFFGFIAPYKGLDLLIGALPRVRDALGDVKLVIAGNIKNRRTNAYWLEIEEAIRSNRLESCLVRHVRFIDDSDIETFFAAADVLVLPYRYIFQSGVLFLAMNYGLPVIATDVGSFRHFVEEGRTGFICNPHDPEQLASCIVRYFESDLYRDLGKSRQRIFEYANDRYSWDRIGKLTAEIYAGTGAGAVPAVPS